MSWTLPAITGGATGSYRTGAGTFGSADGPAPDAVGAEDAGIADIPAIAMPEPSVDRAVAAAVDGAAALEVAGIAAGGVDPVAVVSNVQTAGVDPVHAARDRATRMTRGTRGSRS
jgi:hypothetical protein